jgi:cyanophycin synthetase
MTILQILALAAPNVWAKVPVLEASVDFSGSPYRSLELAAFIRRLGEWLPQMASRHALPNGAANSESERRSSASELGQLVLGESVLGESVLGQSVLGQSVLGQSVLGQPELGQSLGAVTLELQELAYKPVRFAQTEMTAPHACQLIVEYQDEKLGRACLDSARRFCLAAANDDDFDAATEIARLESLADEVCLGRATGPLVDAAQARGIPFRRLDEVSLVQLGHGTRQRRIQTSLTHRTGKIAESIAVDKALTKRLLSEIGIPVPAGRVVGSADEAWRVAVELGPPVAVKPASADYGHGIGLNLKTREQVLDAYTAARAYREEVLVEQFAPGAQYRVTVVGRRVVAAVRREPPRLVGDGRLTISQLIREANRDPRRGESLKLPLTPICADDDTSAILAEHGFTFDSVPPHGREIVLSRIAHSWAGAGVVDVTDAVHPRVAQQCVSAARLVGLDVAGLDVIAEDIGRPLEDQAGVVLEVNAEPTIAFHFPPLGEMHRPVCEAIVESLFPAGQTGRIPLIAVTGLGDNLEVGRCLAGLLKTAGRWTARTSADGLFLNDRQAKSANHSHLDGSRAALVSPEVEAAILERALSSIRNEGLGVDRFDVVIVTRLMQDERGGTCLAPELERAVRLLVETTLPGGAVVIDADDRLAVAITESVGASTIVVGARPCGASMATSNGRGERMIYLRGNDLVLVSRDRKERFVTLDGRLRSQFAGGVRLHGLLAAVAAAWSMGIPVDMIRAGCEQLTWT